MARSTDVALARISKQISDENAAASRDIAIIQNATQLKVAQLQANTQFQTSVLQTLGSAFTTGMQSYFQMRATERQQEREQATLAMNFQLAMNKDRRDELRLGAEQERSKVELGAAQLQLDTARKAAMAQSLYSGPLMELNTAVMNAFTSTTAVGAIHAAAAKLGTLLESEVPIPGTKESEKIPMSAEQLELYARIVGSAQEAGTPFTLTGTTNAQGTIASGLQASGPVGVAFRAADETAGAFQAKAEAVPDLALAPEEVRSLLASEGAAVADSLANFPGGVHAPQAQLIGAAAAAAAGGDSDTFSRAVAELRKARASTRTMAGNARLRVVRKNVLGADASLAGSLANEEASLEQIGNSVRADASQIAAAKDWAAFRLAPVEWQDQIRDLMPKSTLAEMERAHQALREVDQLRSAGMSGVSASVSSPTMGSVPTGLHLMKASTEIPTLYEAQDRDRSARGEGNLSSQVLAHLSAQEDQVLSANVEAGVFSDFAGVVSPTGQLTKGGVSRVFQLAASDGLTPEQAEEARLVVLNADKNGYGGLVPAAARAALFGENGTLSAETRETFVQARKAARVEEAAEMQRRMKELSPAALTAEITSLGAEPGLTQYFASRAQQAKARPDQFGFISGKPKTTRWAPTGDSPAWAQVRQAYDTVHTGAKAKGTDPRGQNIKAEYDAWASGQASPSFQAFLNDTSVQLTPAAASEAAMMFWESARGLKPLAAGTAEEYKAALTKDPAKLRENSVNLLSGSLAKIYDLVGSTPRGMRKSDLQELQLEVTRFSRLAEIVKADPEKYLDGNTLTDGELMAATVQANPDFSAKLLSQRLRGFGSLSPAGSLTSGSYFDNLLSSLQSGSFTGGTAAPAQTGLPMPPAVVGQAPLGDTQRTF